MSNILKPGEHLVKITTVEKGISEVKGLAYFLIRFTNQKGYIDHRVYNNEVTIKFAARLFNAVDASFNAKNDWGPQFEELLNRYLIITVTEVQREKDGKEFKYSNVYRYESAQKTYKYYTDEQPQQYSYYDAENFQFINENSDGDKIKVLPLRKYFKEFDEAHIYMMKKYNEFRNDTTLRSGVINLFSSDRLNNLNDKLVMSVNAPHINYHNEYTDRGKAN